MIRKLDLFPSSDDGREMLTLLGLLERARSSDWALALSEGPNRVGVFLPSPENENRFSFRNVVFSSYLEFRTIDEVQKPSDSQNNICVP
jgi:hypothetical protein